MHNQPPPLLFGSFQSWVKEVVNGQPCPVFDIQTYLSRLSIADGADDKVAFCIVSGYLLTLLYSAWSVLTLAAPAAQLLSLHAVLSSVSLTFSSKDALVH